MAEGEGGLEDMQKPVLLEELENLEKKHLQIGTEKKWDVTSLKRKNVIDVNRIGFSSSLIYYFTRWWIKGCAVMTLVLQEEKTMICR